MAMQPAPMNLVDVDGYRVAVSCTGEGWPAAILDAGMNGGADTWAAVQPSIATYLHVCSFDRLGIGTSDARPFPPTCTQMVQEQRRMLQVLGTRRPYILVGHSLGALNAQRYAMQFPAEVAGLVLVDPPPPDMFAYLRSVLSPPQWEQYASTFTHPDMNRDGLILEQLEVDIAQIQPERLPDVPVVVLSTDGSVPSPLPEDWNWWPSQALAARFQDRHKELVQQVSYGRQICVAHSNHQNLLVTGVAHIVDAVRELGERVRRRDEPIDGSITVAT